MRTFVEANEMIVIFEANKADEIPLSQLYPITSKGIDYLKDFNIPTSQIQPFWITVNYIVIFIQTTLLIWSVNTIQTILI